MRRWVLSLVAVMLLAGIGYGAGWAALAPTDLLRAGGDGLFLVEAQPEAEFGAQAIFLGLGLLVGLISGLALWRTRRGQPVVASLMAAATGLLCALVAAEVGIALGPEVGDPGAVPVGATVAAPLRIEAGGVLFGVAIGAVGVLLIRLLLAEESDQRAIGATDAEVSSISEDGDSPRSSPRLPPET
jgi:hypothetical protein